MDIEDTLNENNLKKYYDPLLALQKILIRIKRL